MHLPYREVLVSSGSLKAPKWPLLCVTRWHQLRFDDLCYVLREATVGLVQYMSWKRKFARFQQAINHPEGMSASWNIWQSLLLSPAKKNCCATRHTDTHANSSKTVFKIHTCEKQKQKKFKLNTFTLKKLFGCLVLLLMGNLSVEKFEPLICLANKLVGWSFREAVVWGLIVIVQ